ncbi:MAG: bifunctional pyr operon transcriptional regulator/uracil phosphoribosyltransferase PyrR [Clostridia bacterium]|nr:bifunctional pyr operon transcriptional regulator/uracil phosphoribosyltransferase PyrR [Clostridia bacterium]
MITIMEKEGIDRAIARIASEAVEHNDGVQDLVIIGIRTRGVIVARRLQEAIAKQEGVLLPVGILDIALQRDDLLSGTCRAVFKGSEIDFDVNGKNVILCDDVMYTGRTIRAAISALNGMGRAKNIRLYTLVDRGHRELPFRADGTGKNVPTSSREKIVVHFKETDGKEGVYLLKENETL